MRWGEYLDHRRIPVSDIRDAECVVINVYGVEVERPLVGTEGFCTTHDCYIEWDVDGAVWYCPVQLGVTLS